MFFGLELISATLKKKKKCLYIEKKIEEKACEPLSSFNIYIQKYKCDSLQTL